MKILKLNIQKELDAHLSRIRSTYEYYNLTQYELLTPTHLYTSYTFLILENIHLLTKSIGKAVLTQNQWFFTKFPPTIFVEKNQKKSISSKTKNFEQYTFYEVHRL